MHFVCLASETHRAIYQPLLAAQATKQLSLVPLAWSSWASPVGIQFERPRSVPVWFGHREKFIFPPTFLGTPFWHDFMNMLMYVNKSGELNCGAAFC